jgi:hypothetical protein
VGHGDSIEFIALHASGCRTEVTGAAVPGVNIFAQHMEIETKGSSERRRDLFQGGFCIIGLPGYVCQITVFGISFLKGIKLNRLPAG